MITQIMLTAIALATIPSLSFSQVQAESKGLRFSGVQASPDGRSTKSYKGELAVSIAGDALTIRNLELKIQNSNGNTSSKSSRFVFLKDVLKAMSLDGSQGPVVLQVQDQTKSIELQIQLDLRSNSVQLLELKDLMSPNRQAPTVRGQVVSFVDAAPVRQLWMGVWEMSDGSQQTVTQMSEANRRLVDPSYKSPGEIYAAQMKKISEQSNQAAKQNATPVKQLWMGLWEMSDGSQQTVTQMSEANRRLVDPSFKSPGEIYAAQMKKISEQSNQAAAPAQQTIKPVKQLWMGLWEMSDGSQQTVTQMSEANRRLVDPSFKNPGEIYAAQMKKISEQPNQAAAPAQQSVTPVKQLWMGLWEMSDGSQQTLTQMSEANRRLVDPSFKSPGEIYAAQMKKISEQSSQAAAPERQSATPVRQLVLGLWEMSDGSRESVGQMSEANRRLVDPSYKGPGEVYADVMKRLTPGEGVVVTRLSNGQVNAAVIAARAQARSNSPSEIEVLSAGVRAAVAAEKSLGKASCSALFSGLLSAR